MSGSSGLEDLPPGLAQAAAIADGQSPQHIGGGQAGQGSIETVGQKLPQGKAGMAPTESIDQDRALGLIDIAHRIDVLPSPTSRRRLR